MDVKMFKSVLGEYTELAREISKMEAELRPLRKGMVSIKQKLLEYMQAKDIDECKSSCDSWAVVRRETSRTEPLKHAHILSELALVMRPARARALVEKINSRRQVLKKERLVHTMKK